MADTATNSTVQASTERRPHSPSYSTQEHIESTLETSAGQQNLNPVEESSGQLTILPDGGSQEYDGDSTPRSEIPSTADEPITATVPSGTTEESADGTGGYFAPTPVRYHPGLLDIPVDSTADSSLQTVEPSSPEVKVSHSSSPAPVESSVVAAEHLIRPKVQRDLSSASTSTIATTSTVRASDFTHQTHSHHLSREFPPFPNQAYSALSQQHHPQPYAPRFLRTRSSNPSPFLSYAAHAEHTATGHPSDPRAAAESGSKTAGNSPASSPGLFTPTTSPNRADFGAEAESNSGYPSPYLHFTQRQMPKETHLAEIERDPISGRKVVNQYEVIDELGRGVHGKVKLGRNLETGQFVAIKIVERYSKRPRLGKAGNHEEKIKREIAILKKARHPNIVGLLEVIDDPDVKKVYIVLEHVEMGEIRWRTEGAREICLVEWRRYTREAHGRCDDEAAAIEDNHILQEAKRLRDRAERRKWRKLHSLKSDGPNTESWSLEHGDDADEDDLYDNASRTSTLTDEANRSHPSSDVHPSNPHEHNDPVFETSIHDDQRQERLQLLGQEPSEEHELHEPSYDDPLDSALEGTMYGAYDFDSPRGRTPSVLGSVESLRRLEEEEDEIPEHFRWVPLMTLSAARSAFRDTVLGLEFLHYQGVIHRDIKPANLLQAADHHIKISDFGVSYLGRETKKPRADADASESEAPDPDDALELAKTVGTPAFYAPELCQTDPDEDTPPVTGQIDLWALGITLYCLVFGRVPFHDNNTFALMRRIAEEKVYIPRHRLKAVDDRAGSRPSSHGPNYYTINSNKRLSHDFEVEEVDDELYDLLSRLLIKDPRKRIKLIEVKRHPWVLRDLGVEPVKWLDETDPSRQMQGQRIAISKEDVDVAVVPFNGFFDRVRDTVRKVVTGALGINRSNSRVKRDRGKSNVGQKEKDKDNQSPSAGSSSSTISQDAKRQQEGRRPSLKPDESIYIALRSSREPDHPLSQSVTASPEATEHQQFFSDPIFEQHSIQPAHEAVERAEAQASHRPPRLDRPISGIEFIRPIQQSDAPTLSDLGASTLPAFPSTPLMVETMSNSSLGGIIDHTKKVMRGIRSRDRKGSGLLDRDGSVESLKAEDIHADPSIGLSNTFAAGHVNPPALPKEGSAAGSSSFSSPVSSRAPSLASASHDRLQNATARSDDGVTSRQSSIASLHARSTAVSALVADLHQPQSGFLPLTVERLESHYPKANLIASSTTEARFLKAQDELIRRRKLEEEQSKDRPSSSLSQRRPLLSPGQIACPPSPDDELFVRKQHQHDSYQKLHSVISPMEALPEAQIPPFNTDQLEHPNIVSSSSEDHFPSGMSQSTSNPSIPSVVSADSSVPPDEGLYTLGPHKESEEQDKATSSPCVPPAHHDDYDGYDGDGDATVDSDSDDSFIEMSRQKSRSQPPQPSESISKGGLASRGKRSSNSVRSTRAGSGNTMKKRSSQSEVEEGDHAMASLKPPRT